MDWQQEITKRLAEMKEKETYRIFRTMADTAAAELKIEGQQLLNLVSNNYLGLAGDERLIQAQAAAAKRYGAGAAASRHVSGNHPLYALAEQAVIRWKQAAAALIVGSGYIANIGVLMALAGRNDIVFSDKLNHASIVDGILASRAEYKRYCHADMAHLERLLQKAPPNKRKLIVTDSVFSMDGDCADLQTLVALKERYQALLIVDEAHAGGVIGPNGRGLAAALGLEDAVDIAIGTFSKAFGSMGAYITGSKWMIAYLTNAMRSLMYTTALPPAVLGSIVEAIRIVETESERQSRLLRNGALFRDVLIKAGLFTYGSTTQIIPVRVGSNAAALSFALALRKAGIAAVAIRPPTVPDQDARIRFTVTAMHNPEALHYAAEQVVEIAERIEIRR